MKKFTKGLLFAAIIIAIGGVILSALYTQTVSDELTRLRRESRSDIVYLRTRVRELESELTACLLSQWDPPSEAVDGVEDVSDDTSEITQDSESRTEEVTVPTHQAPETQKPTAELPNQEGCDAVYVLSEYQGVIGVFDNSGELFKTVNVFVMTLPETERAALEIGIPAYSYEELCALLKQYE